MCKVYYENWNGWDENACEFEGTFEECVAMLPELDRQCVSDSEEECVFILDENGRRWDCMWKDDEIVGVCKYF